MKTPAMGSAHHHPSNAFADSPTTSPADSKVQALVNVASPFDDELDDWHCRRSRHAGFASVAAVKVYTRVGDDGTTGLFGGGRVLKDAPRPTAYGSVDEAQGALGLTRAVVPPGGELDLLLVQLCRDLYVVMAELATLPENRHKLVADKSLVTTEMIDRVERWIDEISARFDAPTEFSVPGGNPTSAGLDFARTVIRRAERDALGVHCVGSHVGPYLNRLSDLAWTLARWQETAFLPAKATD